MKRTPWGPADHAEPLGVSGIVFYSTPGHGGYWVPARLLAQIPAPWRAYAKQWSGSEQWYEEDCAAYAVMLSFPHLFPADTDWLAITEQAASFLPALGDLDMEQAVTATAQEHRP